MPTEREVLQQIVKGRPEGVRGLFDRHGALFREGLLRFYGRAEVTEAPLLARMMESLVSDLAAGEFDDITETFYNWVFRAAFTRFLAMRLDGVEGRHADPSVLFQLTDAINETALPEDVRMWTRSHLEECALCRDLLDRTRDVTVEVRHAGAPRPPEFDAVVEEALRRLGQDRGIDSA